MILSAARLFRNRGLLSQPKWHVKNVSRAWSSCSMMDQSGQADSALAHLENMTSEEKDELKILLHSCCAPCSGAMIEELQAQGVDVTIFFYNPNIHPKKEYEIRKMENVRYAEALGIPIVDADYDVDVWYKRAQGMEVSNTVSQTSILLTPLLYQFDPERGGRCTMCFDMRMERTASYAAENGFTHFTVPPALHRQPHRNLNSKSPSPIRSYGLLL